MSPDYTPGREFSWKYSGELVCDWYDDRALSALAEQLEVNPAVETHESTETSTSSSYTAKLVPQGIGSETTQAFGEKVAEARTYRSASVEVKLRRVLDKLLDQERLFDVVDTFAGLQSLAAGEREQREAEGASYTGPILGGEYEQALSRKVAELWIVELAREWVVAEGLWRVEQSPRQLSLSGVTTAFEVRDWAEDPPVRVHFGEAWSGEGLTLTPQGARRLAREMVFATVFGSADLRVPRGSAEGISIAPVAVFDRKGGDPTFTWERSAREKRFQTIDWRSDGVLRWLTRRFS